MEESTHVRRKHYKGTHPRTFEEKYKEQDPERYRDVVDKVISKGSTPAGMHIPIMVEEILEVLKIKPGEKGLDATLGYGGHSGRILEKMAGQGHLVSLDIDPIEIVKTTERLRNAGYGPECFTPLRINFAQVDQAAAEYGPFDFLMADLGVSSMQIDDPKRGFSYKTEGPLDLRLDPTAGEPAWQRLLHLDRDEISGMLTENSDEPYADEIADVIVKKRWKKEPLETTSALRELIRETLALQQEYRKMPAAEQKELQKKTCQRVFQALRIDVNSEFEVLETFLKKLPDVMAPGGRIAILTFHSGEDRLVKQYFREYSRQGIFARVSQDVIRPGNEECRRNPRARSTKLRWAVK